MKYVYLDWNVIKYIIENRNNQYDTYMRALIVNLKKMGTYFFPYSEAHIRDRANRFSKESYNKANIDLSFLSWLSNSMCLVPIDNIPTFASEKSIFEFFNEVVNKNEELETFRKSNNSLDIFFDAKEYKELRCLVQQIDISKIIAQVLNGKCDPKLERHCEPFITSFNDDLTTLRTKWQSICQSWFSLSEINPSLQQMIIQGYSLLDYHPIFKEKLKSNKNTLDNIIRDGLHSYYASGADFFVTEDENTRKKTSFIYNAFNITTKVVSEKEFIKLSIEQEKNTVPILL